MATKKRVTKKKAKKAAPKKKTKKAPAKRSKAKKKAKSADSDIVDPKSLVVRERARRPSKFDSLAEKLLNNPGKAVVFAVPEGKKPEVYRTMLYTRLPKCLTFTNPKHGMKPSISLLKNGKLGIMLVKA